MKQSRRQRIAHRHFRGRGRQQDVLEILAELLERDGRDDPAWEIAEDERLTQARIALFGSAPK